MLLSLCLSTAGIAAPSYTPERGSSEREAILDALRLDLGDPTIWIVEHMRVSRDVPGFALAMVEVRPAKDDPIAGKFTGWAILSYSNKRWSLSFGQRSRGQQSCVISKTGYLQARRAAALGNADAAFFGPRYKRGEDEAANSDGRSDCSGTAAFSTED